MDLKSFVARCDFKSYTTQEILQLLSELKSPFPIWESHMLACVTADRDKASRYLSVSKLHMNMAPHRTDVYGTQ